MTEPFIVRQDIPHQVTVTEGAQVASTRSNDPQGPQVRKVLATEVADDSASDLHASDIPPPFAPSEATPGSHIFERNVSTVPLDMQSAPEARASDPASQAVVIERSIESENATAVPNTPAPPPASGGVVFERSIQDAQVEAVGSLPEAPPAPGMVTERSLQDHNELLPEDPAPAPANEGPSFERSNSDRFVAAPASIPLPDNVQTLPPEGPAPAPASDGPSFERSSSDRFVAAPAANPLTDNVQTLPPEGATAPDRVVAPAEGSAPVNVQLIPEPVLRSEATLAPQLPPVPTAQAFTEVLETAKEIQDKVEEILGPADPVWEEMDFPARVVRLKIENDKVRAKLERLEALTRSV